jgi:NADH-quinone oxidoreductase subunit G
MGAEIADVILPGSAYTEKDGHFVNLEGRTQKSFKASYPPGDAKEDWDIINQLSTALGKSLNINSRKELEERLINSNSIHSKIGEIVRSKVDTNETQKFSFVNSKIEIDFVDYYFSNHIARSSITMNECRSIKNKLLSTGTEG